MVGNEDPDAVIPESGVLLPGHEPQHRTHGPHHEPTKDTVWQSAADQEDVDPKKEAQDEEAESDWSVEQQREEQEAVTREPVRVKEPLRPLSSGMNATAPSSRLVMVKSTQPVLARSLWMTPSGTWGKTSLTL